jgi:hypothetical protein
MCRTALSPLGGFVLVADPHVGEAVSELERDPSRTPRLDSVTALAEALGLDADGNAALLRAARPDAPPAAPRPLTERPLLAL